MNRSPLMQTAPNRMKLIMRCQCNGPAIQFRGNTRESEFRISIRARGRRKRNSHAIATDLSLEAGFPWVAEMPVLQNLSQACVAPRLRWNRNVLIWCPD
jgi:hypothetical protein